jgi:hypothetical protein
MQEEYRFVIPMIAMIEFKAEGKGLREGYRCPNDTRQSSDFSSNEN